VRLGSGASIVGRVEERSGEPVAFCEIWRVAADVPLATLLQSYQKPVDTAATDRDGRFRFEDVPAGTWLVGPPQVSRWDAEARTADALCAVAQPVRVEPSSTQIDVVIRVDRGLYVSGTVLDAGDAAVQQCMVQLTMEDTGLFESGEPDASGHFKIGPLPAGECSLQVGGWNGKYAQTEPIRVRSGASDVVVRVHVGGSIRGRVIDASGQLRDAELVFSRAGEDDGWMMTSAFDGKVEISGLLPGTYALSATSGGSFGMRGGLVVRMGEALENIDVLLEPGARLKLRYNGARAFASFEILAAGLLVGGDGLERGTTATHTVPAGEIEVRWRSNLDPGSTKSQRFTLIPGEERELVWDGAQ
jgi:hypothetical protein